MILNLLRLGGNGRTAHAAPVGGNPSGDVTLVEFFDYNCPYCRRVAPTVVELQEADPGLRVVYKEFPILGPGL